MRKYNNMRNVTGEQIRKYRLLKKVSQTYVCQKLELLGIAMAKEDLCKIEKNHKVIKDFELWALSKVLDVSLEKLFEDFKNTLDD